MREGALHVRCQYGWRDVCGETAARQVGGGADMRRYCDPHEVPTYGGTFVGEFVIAPETTREELLEALEGSSVRIYSASGRDVHELYCCACGEWTGDALDPDIEHVSEPLDAECAADMR